MKVSGICYFVCLLLATDWKEVIGGIQYTRMERGVVPEHVDELKNTGGQYVTDNPDSGIITTQEVCSSGDVSVADVCKICQAGYYRENGQCLECKRHTYQSQTGKTYCDYCDLGYKTATTGSTSKDDCQPDCPAGEYRTVAQYCVICPRGTWRGLAYDDCQACPVGKTTYDGELAASESDCAMDICDLGAFWNRSEKTCVDCDFGFYNDEEYALSCKPCNGNLTTKEQKSDSSTDCTFYCAAGYEVESSVDKKCKACERGYYKTNVGATKFDTCTMCSEKTTDDIAVTTAEECNVPICEAGEYIVEGVCEACPVDFWSDVADPYTTTQCEPCSCELCDKKGTLNPGANSSDLCMRYCDPGMELLEGQCEMCKRGFYKDNVGEARFQMCRACSDDGSIITDDVGSESDSYCVIPNCKAGQFMFEDNSVIACHNCPKDSYQTESSPVSSVTCTACPALGDVAQGTMYTGAIAEDECKPICPGGKQYDEERKMCTDCPIGQYKLATNRFGTCMDCPDSRFTTRVPGADSSAKCDLRDCGPGTYIVVDNNGNADCVNCSNTDCEYQDEGWQTECKKCGPNLCTLYPGAKSEDDCTIFCGAGVEGTETCEPCKDGYFKSQSGYGQCEECPPGYTSSADDRTACNLRNCWYGTEYVNEGGVENCIDCKEGFYKDVIGNDVTCQQCEPSYTTDGLGKRNCALRNCLPGTTLEDEDCVECAIGTYKSETGNMACTDCLTNRTTDGTGKTSQAQCDIGICPPGQYRVEKSNCARCPVNQYQPDSGKTQCIACEDGQITMQQESTTKDQCVPECKEGEQYNTTTKLCDPCKVGYYKNVVSNTQLCVACESGKTTVSEGSGSSADCSQTVCPAGTYNVRTPTEVICVPCEIGFYNPSVGKDACIACIPDYTTFKTGRVYFSDCFQNCAPGFGFLGNNAGGGVCQQCGPGTFNDKKGTNKNLCKKCPTGKTSLSSGSVSCEFDDPTTPKDTFVDVTIILVYEVDLDSCDVTYLSPALNAILRVLRAVFYQEKLKRYSGNNSNKSYCNSGCANMIVRQRLRDNSCRIRRKRAIHILEVEAIFQYASAIVEDTTDNNQEISTPDALYQVLVHNEEELTPVELKNTGGQYVTDNPDSGIITTQEICSLGDVSVADVCTSCPAEEYLEDRACVKCPVETYQNLTGQTSCTACPLAPCPVGEYWEDRVCVKCPKDTYQNQTGQTSCIACPLDTYHDLNRQTSQAACVSYCVSTNYCNSRGSCTSTGRRTASCTCYDDYNGDRCEAKATPCPVGEYWEDRVCVKCPKDTYQNQTGQTSCIACPLDTYHDLNRQTSQAACVSYCVSTNYCNSRGSCTSTGRRTASCTCYDDYNGDRCEAKAMETSNRTVILVSTVGGGVLAIAVVVVIVYKWLNSKRRQKRMRSSDISRKTNAETLDEDPYDRIPPPNDHEDEGFGAMTRLGSNRTHISEDTGYSTHVCDMHTPNVYESLRSSQYATYLTLEDQGNHNYDSLHPPSIRSYAMYDDQNYLKPITSRTRSGPNQGRRQRLNNLQANSATKLGARGPLGPPVGPGQRPGRGSRGAKPPGGQRF